MGNRRDTVRKGALRAAPGWFWCENGSKGRLEAKFHREGRGGWPSEWVGLALPRSGSSYDEGLRKRSIKVRGRRMFRCSYSGNERAAPRS